MSGQISVMQTLMNNDETQKDMMDGQMLSSAMAKTHKVQAQL
jgi:hypothetical protein